MESDIVIRTYRDLLPWLVPQLRAINTFCFRFKAIHLIVNNSDKQALQEELETVQVKFPVIIHTVSPPAEDTRHRQGKLGTSHQIDKLLKLRFWKFTKGERALILEPWEIPSAPNCPAYWFNERGWPIITRTEVAFHARDKSALYFNEEQPIWSAPFGGLPLSRTVHDRFDKEVRSRFNESLDSFVGRSLINAPDLNIKDIVANHTKKFHYVVTSRNHTQSLYPHPVTVMDRWPPVPTKEIRNILAKAPPRINPEEVIDLSRTLLKYGKLETPFIPEGKAVVGSGKTNYHWKIKPQFVILGQGIKDKSAWLHMEKVAENGYILCDYSLIRVGYEFAANHHKPLIFNEEYFIIPC
jgi:hypothetical protein